MSIFTRLYITKIKKSIHFRFMSTENSTIKPENIESISEGNISQPAKLSGFAQSFKKYTSQNYGETEDNTKKTFAYLLRNSKFIDLGDPQGKIVYGEIFNIIDDDLYIDFGWKFHCVCTRPIKNSEDYVIGSKVRIMINELELSSRFLGADTDLTLLEADCRILHLVKKE